MTKRIFRVEFGDEYSEIQKIKAWTDSTPAIFQLQTRLYWFIHECTVEGDNFKEAASKRQITLNSILPGITKSELN